MYNELIEEDNNSNNANIIINDINDNDEINNGQYIKFISRK